MRAPRGLEGLTLGPAVSTAGSDLALANCLSVVFLFLTGGSSDFLAFTTSFLRRLRSDVLESACCFKRC